MKLLDVLREIQNQSESVVMLRDGATDWDVDNLVEALESAEIGDDREYRLTRENDLYVIRLIDANGFDGPAIYTQFPLYSVVSDKSRVCVDADMICERMRTRLNNIANNEGRYLSRDEVQEELDKICTAELQKIYKLKIVA